MSTRSEQEKAVLGAQTLASFLNQFGESNDVVIRTMLEVLTEELINAKAIPLLGEPEQTGDQTGNNLEGSKSSHIQADGLATSESAENLGATNPKDHLR